MKKIAFMLFALFTVSAQASVALECTTMGDALDSVTIIDNGKRPSLLKISYMDESTELLTISTNLKSIKKDKDATLIAAKDIDYNFGGAIADAALMQIKAGQKTAILAHRGSVFILNCGKK